MSAERLRDQLIDAATPQRLRFLFAATLFAHLAAFLALETTSGVFDRLGRVRGRDFLLHYLEGRNVLDERGRRLYDQEHLAEEQEALAPISAEAPRYYSLYPPTVALLFAPLALLPYTQAVLLWWA